MDSRVHFYIAYLYASQTIIRINIRLFQTAPIGIIIISSVFLHIGAATGVQADYCSEEFIITIEPGQESMMFCRDILINNDMICEGPEDFSLVLESGQDGGSVITNAPGTATIIDDDSTLQQ